MSHAILRIHLGQGRVGTSAAPKRAIVRGRRLPWRERWPRGGSSLVGGSLGGGSLGGGSPDGGSLGGGSLGGGRAL